MNRDLNHQIEIPKSPVNMEKVNENTPTKELGYDAKVKLKNKTEKKSNTTAGQYAGKQIEFIVRF